MDPSRNDVRRKNLDRPDERREFPNGFGVVVEVGSHAVGQAVLQPGWRWSTDIRPAVGTPSCQIHHFHVVLAGRFAVRMDRGEEHEFVANDVVDVPPGHDAWVVGDEPAIVLDISGNVTDFALAAARRRAVVTMLMTDIVDSTKTASAIGDAAWRQRLGEHDRVVRRQLERFAGREVETTGDGFLAIFDSAGAALLCALSSTEATRAIGLEIRAGVHTGEIDVNPDGVAGVAVHATARVMSVAGPSQVLTSALTRALAEGSRLRFEPRGRHELKGLPEPIEILEVSRAI
jgi:class 3 adenylate cyclase